MSKLYSSPFRVFLLLGGLALVGIYSGIKLPISLFPNSAKPRVWVGMSYGSLTADEFLNSYGKRLESQLKQISTDKIEVEKLEASYDAKSADFDVTFRWGVVPTDALKEVERVVNAFAARLPEESRDSVSIWLSNKNSGFFALSFFSDERDLQALYDLLEPILSPKLARINDAQNPVLWNPSSKEIRVQLNPNAMANLGLFPRQVDEAIYSALGSRYGGSLSQGPNLFQIQMPKSVKNWESLADTPVLTQNGRMIHLGEIARIDLGPKTLDTRSFRTNGAPSLILYATPKPGGNVKKMSEDLLALVKETMPTLPKDVQYRTLVDPSEFIRSAVNNVFHEVAIAALLAVLVLFVFIGSFKNVITAAIEIPLSMILAFILMRLFGMNLNLISLGGLALSAGMNVDASVVVMENIFRHFELSPGPHSFQRRLEILTSAVNEVRFAIIASTIASLVVFLPLTFTSDLSYAILGDLAKAVVFSHGLSAFVALILVPTVRLLLMGREGVHHVVSPIEPAIRALESKYETSLRWFLRRPKVKWSTYAGLVVVLVALSLFVLPNLPREIVGTPDTDWLILGVDTSGNTLLRQMESQIAETEKNVLDKFSDRILYTFIQTHSPNSSMIMARLKEKRDIQKLMKEFEEAYVNSPTLRYWVAPWNPSELPIPDPPHLKISVRGGTLRERADTAAEVSDYIQDKKIFTRIGTEPSTARQKEIVIQPRPEIWASLSANGVRLSPGDLADLIRVATQGRRSNQMPVKELNTDIVLSFPAGRLNLIEDIGAIPIKLGQRIYPLKALAKVGLVDANPTIYRENEREVFFITGRENRGEEKQAPISLEKSKAAIKVWESERKSKGINSPVTVHFEDPSKDLTDAIHQLSWAVTLSVVLIFITLLVQFGSIIEPLLVLVSIPLGFIGVLVSLWVFRSTLSLNSILGVILLNGIAVANSIILVDFVKRLIDEGMDPLEAAVTGSRQRLRPILITSLTTVLGMIPIAVGSGEGGKILQPLGIAVSGGLWISMLLTLYLVPALYVAYAVFMRSRTNGRNEISVPAGTVPAALFICFMSSSLFSAETQTNPFESTINKMVERHVTQTSQRAQRESVEARNLYQHLIWLPSVSASAKEIRRRESGVTLARRGIEGSIELNIFKFGSDAALVRAANAEERASEALYQEALLAAELESAKSYFSYLLTDKESKIYQNLAELRELAKKISEDRHKKGLMARQEVEKFTIDLENAKARVNDAKEELSKIKSEFESLLGESTNAPTEWPLVDKIPSFKPSFLSTPITESIKNRPDTITSLEGLKYADARVSQTWGKILPSLDVSFSAGYYTNEISGRSSSGTEWAGVAAITIPLFDRLANYSSYRESINLKTKAEIDVEKTRRRATAEVASLREIFRMASSTAVSRESVSGTSQSLFKDAQAKFQKGLISANDLALDQERWLNSELLKIRGWYEAHLNLVKLCHAHGLRLFACLKG